MALMLQVAAPVADQVTDAGPLLSLRKMTSR